MEMERQSSLAVSCAWRSAVPSYLYVSDVFLDFLVSLSLRLGVFPDVNHNTLGLVFLEWLGFVIAVLQCISQIDWCLMAL